jgi:CubicO group peptidase (beta-lactamase class C family)
LFDGITKSSQIHEAVLFVENFNGDFSEGFGYGGRDLDTPMIMASITKMFTTACVLKLCEERQISLNNKIARYFDEEQLKGLHVYKRREYSFDLTISDLLFQTSGLPDSFEAGNTDSFIQGDTYTAFIDVLAETKKQKPHFAPNTGNKAYYANINFDLLGEILVKVTGKPLIEIYNRVIFTPLGLTHSYLAASENDFVPYVYYGKQKLERPKTITSSGAAGRCISTPRNLMAFSKGFWNGSLFDKAVFEQLAVYKGLQAAKGPVNYGGGYIQIPLGGLTTLFMGKGELLGHSGSTGSFMFYYPEKGLHFTGDLVQFKNPALPIRLVIKLAMTQ